MALSKITNNQVALSGIPVGGIIQVKQATATGDLGSGDQDLVSVSITPTDSTNKILIMGQTSCYTPNSITSRVEIKRGSTVLYTSGMGVGWGSVGYNDAATSIFLDDPQTTSAITYTLFGGSNGSSKWGFYTATLTTSTSITVMEVVV